MIGKTLLSFIILLTLLIQTFSPIVFASNIAPYEETKALSSSPFEEPLETQENIIEKPSILTTSHFPQSDLPFLYPVPL